MLHLAFKCYFYKQLSKELNQSFEQIDEWFKTRSKQSDGKSTPMSKFAESAWRFVFYLSIFIYGVLILFQVFI